MSSQKGVRDDFEWVGIEQEFWSRIYDHYPYGPTCD